MRPYDPRTEEGGYVFGFDLGSKQKCTYILGRIFSAFFAYFASRDLQLSDGENPFSLEKKTHFFCVTVGTPPEYQKKIIFFCKCAHSH